MFCEIVNVQFLTDSSPGLMLALHVVNLKCVMATRKGEYLTIIL